jgi:hypothetical protein
VPKLASLLRAAQGHLQSLHHLRGRSLIPGLEERSGHRGVGGADISEQGKGLMPACYGSGAAAFIGKLG